MIPRPIESAPAVFSQPNAIEWPVEAGEDETSGNARRLARGSRCNRPSRYGRTKAHQPDLSGLGHEFDDELHCSGCGMEWLAVCAFRERCEA